MKQIPLLIFCIAISLPGLATIDSLIAKKIVQCDSLRGLGDSEEALRRLQQVRVEQGFSNAACQSKGDYFHKMGVYHYDLYHSEKALTFWRDSALQIRLSCLGKFDKETANSYYAVALAYRDFSDANMEAENIIRAIDILEALPRKDTLDLAYKYLQAGILYNTQGDYYRSESFLLQAQRYYKAMKYNGIEVAELLNELGLTKNHQAQYLVALNYFTAAKEIFQKRKEKESIANCYHNSSKSYYMIQDYKTAEDYALQAISMYTTLNTLRHLPHCYELLGNIKKKQKKYESALSYFQKTLAFYLKQKDQVGISNSYENIADVYIDQQDYEQALNHYQIAITYLIPSFQYTDHSVLPKIENQYIIDKLDLLRVLALKGNTYYKKYNQSKSQKDILLASETYLVMDTLITLLRHHYATSGSKFLLTQNTLSTYENAIETQLELFKINNNVRHIKTAYWYSAKNKAIVLLDGLQDLNAKMSDIPDSLRLKEIELKRTITQLEEQLFKSQKENEHLGEKLQTKLFAAQRSYTKFIAQLEKDFPSYYQLKYDFPKLSSIERLQNGLAKDQVILEYFVGKKNIFTFIISKSNINFIESKKPDNFDELCLNFRNSTDGTLAFTAETFLPLANQLYSLLLEKPLAQLSDIKRIIVIPNDKLLQVSFDNMLYKPARETDWGELPFLIKEYAISAAYSSQLLFQPALIERAKKAEQLFGGFGLEYDDLTLKGIDLLGFKKSTWSESRNIGKLVYSDDEVLEIANLLNGAAWVNKQATKRSFLENADKFRILHFAMHSIINEKVPLNSSLIFSRETDSTDFILRASELYAINLNAELIVLSACNTGNGSIAQGEGVRSLARAFTYSGSPGLIASLWNASDFSSKEILVSFYKYLKKGHPKDIALQYAKLDYLKTAPPSYNGPGFWSHLILLGNHSPIDIPASNTNLFLWISGLAAVFVVGFTVWSLRLWSAFGLMRGLRNHKAEG